MFWSGEWEWTSAFVAAAGTTGTVVSCASETTWRFPIRPRTEICPAVSVGIDPSYAKTVM
jgi:hypothetical protein